MPEAHQFCVPVLRIRLGHGGVIALQATALVVSFSAFALAMLVLGPPHE